MSDDVDEETLVQPADVMQQYYGADCEPGSLFEQVFAPKSQTLILDALVSERGKALTVTEIVNQSEGLAKSSVHNHIDTLVGLDIAEEAGKKGNAWTYRLNTKHPVGQLLAMLDNIFMWGRTPQLLDEAFIFEGDTGDLQEALEDENLSIGGK